MRLTTHFTLDEMTRSSTAERLGIDNTPGKEVIANLTIVAEGLEKIRSIIGLFNQPVFIDSGYRCVKLNGAVGGAIDSAHMSGFAADFVSPAAGTPIEITRKIAASDLQFDQLIQEGTWVHISFDPRMRRKIMTAHFANGRATYTEGV